MEKISLASSWINTQFPSASLQNKCFVGDCTSFKIYSVLVLVRDKVSCAQSTNSPTSLSVTYIAS